MKEREELQHVDRAARRECSPTDELFREVESTAIHTTPHLLDVGALLSDLPAHGFLRGRVGTVVELLDGACEVEFPDDEGKTRRLDLRLQPCGPVDRHDRRPGATAPVGVRRRGRPDVVHPGAHVAVLGPDEVQGTLMTKHYSNDDIQQAVSPRTTVIVSEGRHRRRGVTSGRIGLRTPCTSSNRLP